VVDPSESDEVIDDLSATVQTLGAEGLTAREIAALLEVEEERVSALLREFIDAWQSELDDGIDPSSEEF